MSATDSDFLQKVAAIARNGRPTCFGFVRNMKVENDIAYLDIDYVANEQKEEQVAIDLISKKELWKHVGNQSHYYCIQVEPQELYLGGNNLIKINKKDGQLIWQNNRIRDLTCPLLFNNRLYARKRDRDLYIYDPANGNLLSRYHLQYTFVFISSNSVDPIVANDMLIVVQNPKRVVALY